MTITWNDNWNREFESDWSKFHKFLAANCLTVLDLQTNGEDILPEIIEKLNISESNYKLMLSARKAEDFVYCRTCLQTHGYHSILHQSYKYCFIHGEALIDRCPSCSDFLPNSRASKVHYLSPFTCLCSYQLREYNCPLEFVSTKINDGFNEATLVVNYNGRNGFKEMHLKIHDDHVPSVLPIISNVIFSILRSFCSEIYRMRSYNHENSFESDLFREGQIKTELEDTIRGILDDDFSQSPVLSFLEDLIRGTLKQFKMNYFNFANQIRDVLRDVLHIFYIDKVRFESIKSIVPFVVEGVIADEKIYQLNLLIYTSKIERKSITVSVPDKLVIFETSRYY